MLLLEIIKELYNRSLKDEVPAMGAQLSYHLLLAFFPFLIFLVTLVGYTPLTGDKVIGQLQPVLPETTYKMVVSIVRDITARKSGTLLSFGAFSSLWIASNGLTAVIKGINKAYGCVESRPFWKVKGLSLLYTAGIALLILFSLVLQVFGEPVGRYLFGLIGYPLAFMRIWNRTRYCASIAALMFVLTTLYYITPDKRLRFSEILPGVIFASALWIAISFGFSFYVNNYSNYSGLYGNIGGVIILLVWLYWGSIIILLGGELNAIISAKR